MKITTHQEKDIKLQITFPFARNNDLNEIIIYQKTIAELMKLFAQEKIYISFNRNNKGIICIPTIVDFIYSLDEEIRKNLEYPSVQLLSQEKQFDNRFICITSNEKLTIGLADIHGNTYKLLARYFKTPPVQLNNLIICINCDIEYILV